MGNNEFDLDLQVESTNATVTPQITSYSLCTPGCPTGGFACFTAACTGGCTISSSSA